MQTTVVAVAAKNNGVQLLEPLTPLHDLIQLTRNLRQVLQDDKQKIGFFLGAGCPLGIRDETGETSLSLIPAVVPLTEYVGANLATLSAGKDKSTSKLKAHWDILQTEAQTSDGITPTVEDILTELRTLSNRKGKAEVQGISKESLIFLDEKICEIISECMRKELPRHRHSYERFTGWIAGIHRTHPLEIFTPNYDLLFEQAFERRSLPHFDGFVGSHEPWFDLASIEHDLIPNRWTRLWKLHGSINWERVDDTRAGETVARVVRVTREAQKGRVMIYPSHLKYDQSRRMPYLAMLDRLRAFFRNTDAPRLIVCGYSFLDDHINEIILDGLRGNRNAHCFALMYSNLDVNSRVADCARKQSNLSVLTHNAAVIGSRAGLYKRLTDVQDLPPWIKQSSEGSTTTPEGPQCTLGDFHGFSLLLEQIVGGHLDATRA